MKGFIEVTDYEYGFKILCSIDKIISVANNTNKGVFIETGFDSGGISSVVLVKETFGEVKEKIQQGLT